LDAMPQGGRLDVELRVDVNRSIVLTVRDTGAGISPAIADRLFTPFATSKPTGTGLGLSICRRIVEGHGGSISAQNSPVGGASFTMQLPITGEESANVHRAGSR